MLSISLPLLICLPLLVLGSVHGMLEAFFEPSNATKAISRIFGFIEEVMVFAVPLTFIAMCLIRGYVWIRLRHPSRSRKLQG